MEDGGPAFPLALRAHDMPESFSGFGMTLRDWFATHCPEAEIPKFTVGDVRKAFNLPDDHFHFGTDEQWRLMRCRARYAYADTMLDARKTKVSKGVS